MGYLITLEDNKKFIQEVTGTFLYYTKAVNATILLALGTAVTQQLNPTKDTMKEVKHFLNYTSTHPNTIIIYCKSDMVRIEYSNTS